MLTGSLPSPACSPRCRLTATLTWTVSSRDSRRRRSCMSSFHGIMHCNQCGIYKLFMGLKSWVQLAPTRPGQLGRYSAEDFIGLDSSEFKNLTSGCKLMASSSLHTVSTTSKRGFWRRHQMSSFKWDLAAFVKLLKNKYLYWLLILNMITFLFCFDGDSPFC